MLEGQFTRLRPVDLADAEWMRRLRTSPAVMEAFQYRYPITDLQQEEFLQKLSVDREQFYFVAEDPSRPSVSASVPCIGSITATSGQNAVSFGIPKRQAVKSPLSRPVSSSATTPTRI